MYCICGSYAFHWLTDSGERRVEQIKAKHMIFIPNSVMHGVEQVVYPYVRFFLHLPVHRTIVLLNNSQMLSPFQSSLIIGGEKSFVPRVLDATKSAEVIEPLFSKMLDAFILSDVGNNCTELQITSLLGFMFCELYKNHQEFFKSSGSSKNSLINEVKSFIEKNYDQPLTVNDLAKRFYVHPDYLSHCFTKQEGISPKKYLLNLRLSIAQKLLEASEDTVQNIAYKVGFTDVNIFIQSFRNNHDITPKQYRKKVTNEMVSYNAHSIAPINIG
jgi:AraC-like DNA-binding protein